MNARDSKTPPSFRVVVPVTASRASSAFRLVDASGASVTEVNEFLDATAVSGFSPQTLRTYAFALRSAWQWIHSCSLSIDAMSEADLFDFIRYMQEKVSAKARPPAARSINLRVTVLRAWYRFHFDRDLPRGKGVLDRPAALLRHSPSSEIAFPQRIRRRRLLPMTRVPGRLIEPLTRVEVERFFKHLHTWRDLSLVSLMLLSGLRSKELLALELDDLSFEEEQVRVRGKGDKDRVLPLARETQNVLSSYLRVERPSSLNRRLFLVLKGKARGEPMTRSGLRSVFRYHRAVSKVPKANPHRFRHTFAADMVRAGITLPVLQRLMGHTHIQMTLRYVSLDAQDVREAFNKAIQRRAEDSR